MCSRSMCRQRTLGLHSNISNSSASSRRTRDDAHGGLVASVRPWVTGLRMLIRVTSKHVDSCGRSGSDSESFSRLCIQSPSDTL